MTMIEAGEREQVAQSLDLMEIYQRGVLLSNEVSQDSELGIITPELYELDDIKALGAQLINRSVRIRAISKKDSPIQRLTLLTERLANENVEFGLLPTETIIAGGNEYTPTRARRPRSVRGSIFDADPTTPFLVVRPRITQPLSRILAERFLVRMVSDEGEPLVEATLLN
jgi:hypothetical protein